ncbi:MAG: hypothetical protein ACPGXK_02375 [Phycisphaerae bacterium]
MKSVIRPRVYSMMVMIAVTCLAHARVDATVIFVEPIRASGIEGVDWVAGPGPHDMQLLRGGQFLELKIFIEDFGASEEVSAYQTTLDCASLSSDKGARAEVVDINCSQGEGVFDVDYCMGINEADPAYL